MNTYPITILPEGITVEVPQDATVLEALRQAGLHPDAPCGGKNQCGKCLVTVIEGPMSRQVRACAVKVTGPMVIRRRQQRAAAILTDGTAESAAPPDPILKALPVILPVPKLGSRSSDWDRLRDAVALPLGLKPETVTPNLSVMKRLHTLLKQTGNRVTAIVCHGQILDVCPPNAKAYAMAFDIGTTTLVGYLLEPATGETLAVVSDMNPQAAYGADVISRCNYILEKDGAALQEAILGGLSDLIVQACAKAGLEANSIYTVCAVGNTCMHHLLLGLRPDSLVHAPYLPAATEALDLPAVGLPVNPAARLLLLPNIAGFVGADTVGGLVATSFDQWDQLTLFVDIGTNGEMVLGTKDKAVACSTAAGPAFEGARIHCGMRGAPGAVDHTCFEHDTLTYTTVSGKPAIGLCGSGLLDLVSCLLHAGILDETGRIAPRGPLSHQVVTENGQPAFRLTEKVVLLQKDIRELQLAKAAVAAGIELMCGYLGVKETDIKTVLIAGAFGNYMSPASACGIGMLPPELLSRIRPIGNAAGEGAKLAILRQSRYRDCSRWAASMDFLELATRPEFQDAFVEHLEFPCEEEWV